MSAQPIEPDVEPRRAISPMRLSDIPEVAVIEQAIYSAPWSPRNFVDSLSAGYCSWVLRGGGPAITGYFVLMAAVDEAHLLNVSVAAAEQGRGHGLYLLRKAAALAVEHRASSLILEVRPSNLRALAVYRRFGFRDHGLRRRYYPLSATDQQSREDALVLRLPL